jgi:cytoskeletal protein RodZ
MRKTTESQKKDWEQLGAQLRRRRDYMGVSIEQAAKDLRIDNKHLEQIEEGDVSHMSSHFFVQTYIERYAAYLCVPKHFYLLYEQCIQGLPKDSHHITPKEEVHESVRRKSIGEFIYRYRWLLLVGAGVFILLWYIIGLVRSFNEKPVVDIFFPPQNYHTTETSIVISGSVSADATISINDQAVDLIDDNAFSHALALPQSGETTFVIYARSQRGTETKVTRKVFVDNDPSNLQNNGAIEVERDIDLEYAITHDDVDYISSKIHGSTRVRFEGFECCTGPGAIEDMAMVLYENGDFNFEQKEINADSIRLQYGLSARSVIGMSDAGVIVSYVLDVTGLLEEIRFIN